ncbi:MAG: response regulator, partial [Cyanobacteria bacterium J06588_5]
ITIHSPVLSKQIGNPVSLYYEYWNYAALSRLVKLKQFPRAQFAKIVEDSVAEVLFDILQATAWQYKEFGNLLIEVQPGEAGNMPFVMLENLQSWQKAQQSWQQWEQAGLTKISPNWAPVIKNIDALKEQTPLQTFQTLNSFANGENTLRDLAIKVKQPIIPIARSIRPYVVKKLLSFTEIPDIVENAHQGFHLDLIEIQQPSVDSNPAESPEDPAPPAANSANSTEPKTGEEEEVTLEVAQELTTPKPTEKSATVDVSKEELPAKKPPTENVSKEELPAEKASVEETSTPQTVTDRTPVESESKINETTAEEPVSKEIAQREPDENAANQSSPRPSQASAQKTIVPKVAAPPVKESQIKTNDSKTRKLKNRRRNGRRSNLPKVVYVDDSPSDSRTMAAIVEKMGYQYFNIPDPLQALPKLIELKPKLIFLDLVMPIANGYEVCAQIRRITAFKKIPIIIVTSNDGIADRVRAKIVGASGFMGKPIQEKKVKKVFKKHLSHVGINR